MNEYDYHQVLNYCKSERKLDTFFEIAKIGKKFHDANIENVFKIHPEKIFLLEPFLNEPRSMILFGGVGRGKTYASIALIKELAKNHSMREIRYINSHEIDEKSLELSNDGRELNIFFSNLSKVKILFIDDFGMNRITERTIRDMYKIIDYRWSHELVTVVSTNMKPTQIKEVYGERISSRMNLFQEIYFSGEDLRCSRT